MTSNLYQISRHVRHGTIYMHTLISQGKNALECLLTPCSLDTQFVRAAQAEGIHSGIGVQALGAGGRGTLLIGELQRQRGGIQQD